jgi:hypothetical protein
VKLKWPEIWDTNIKKKKIIIEKRLIVQGVSGVFRNKILKKLTK